MKSLKILKEFCSKNTFLSSLFLAIVFLKILSCNEDIINKHDDLILNFNTSSMANLYLPNFEIYEYQSIDSVDKKFSFTREVDSLSIYFTFRICNSVEETNNYANEYVNSISIKMEAGPFEQVRIGDEYWWWAPKVDFSNVTSLVFVKRNIFFYIGCNKYFDLIGLAINIDNDIKKRKSYITFQ